MTDRTTLALAACQGLSDAELAERGTGGYLKMRDRKRKYSTAAKMLYVAGQKQHAELQKAQARIAQLEAEVAALKALQADVEDTTEAAQMLQAISAKKAQG
jgi:cell division protein FtsB